jgi:hypothetical protein
VHDLAVKSHRELMAALKAIDISVPARGEGRTKAHTERWSIARFLATFGHTGVIRYPLTVSKGERPDFRLNVRGTLVGVEVTESVSQDFARFDALRQNESNLAVVDTSLFRPGMPRRSTQELREILNTRPHGEGWAGEGAERDWAHAIEATVLAKAEVATKPGFTLFARNWLLVYDNWSLPLLNIPRAVELLFQRLAGQWPSVVFSDFFVERDKSFLHLSPPSYSVRALNHIWREG